MESSLEILVRNYEQQLEHIRHLEDQRATFTNFVLVTSAVIAGFIVQEGLSLNSIPLSILLSIFGVFGTLASEKYYERYQLHNSLANNYYGKIDAMCKDVDLKELKKEAIDKHNKSHHFSKLHVHTIWRSLNILIGLLGIALTVVAILA